MKENLLPTPSLPTPHLAFAGAVSHLIHASDDVTTPSLPFLFLAYDKDVVMKSQWKFCATAALIGTALLSTGCQSLPWAGNRNDKPVMTADQYVEQAAANIRYDTSVDASVDTDTDYQPPAPRSSFVAPSSASPRSSSGGGSCCH